MSKGHVLMIVIFLSCLSLFLNNSWANTNPLFIENITITDVSDSQLSVIWAVNQPASCSLVVYNENGDDISSQVQIISESALHPPAETNGVMKVTVKNLMPDSTYQFQTITDVISDSTRHISENYYPVKTEVESSIVNNNYISQKVYQNNGSDHAKGTLLLVYVPGASFPLSGWVGVDFPSPLAGVDLSNLHKISDGTSYDVASGIQASLWAFGGELGYATTEITIDETQQNQEIEQYAILIPDQQPTVSNPIQDVNVVEDAVSTSIDLNNVFTDIDNDDSEIVISLLSNSNNELVSATMMNNTLVLDYQNNKFGNAEIMLEAISNGKSVTDSFNISVLSVDDPPFIKNAISNIEVIKNAEDDLIELDNVFSDADNDDALIEKQIFSNSNPNIVNATIESSGSMLKLDYLDDSVGVSTIQVIGISNGISVTATFSVRVISGIPISVEINESIMAPKGAVISTAITLNNTDRLEIKSLDITVSSDHGNLSHISATLEGGILESNYTVMVNATSDETHLAIYWRDGDYVYESGQVLVVNFLVKGDQGQEIPLQITEAVLNESVVSASDGLLTVKSSPTASDGSISTDEDVTYNGSLVNLVSDPDGDSLTYDVKKQGEKGIVSLNQSTGEFSYSPFDDENGSDFFIYQVLDGDYQAVTATINVTINPINDPPIADNKNFIIDEDTQLSDTLPYTELDTNELDLFFSIINEGKTSIGTVELINQSTGEFKYTPDNNQFGSDSFIFMLNDGEANSNTATVNINISAINDPPSIAPIMNISGNKNYPISTELFINDIDTAIEKLVITSTISNPGIVSQVQIQGEGNKRYLVISPVYEQSGTATITLKVTDDQEMSSSINFDITFKDVSLNISNGNCLMIYPGDLLFIPIAINSNDAMNNATISLKYDSSYLFANDPPISLVDTILDGKDYQCKVNIYDNELSVELNANSNPVSSSGILAYVMLNVSKDVKVGEKLDTLFGDSIFNDYPIAANPGCIEITGLYLSGKIDYRVNEQGQKGIEDIIVELSLGSEILTSTTDTQGAFTFAGLHAGNYTMTAIKQEINGSRRGISSTDVTYIAQIKTKKKDPTCEEMIAADVSGNGYVYSMDATEVARYKALRQEFLNETNTHWVFLPDRIDTCSQWPPILYSSVKHIELIDNVYDANMIAIRLGDVSGNYLLDTPENNNKRKRRRTKNSISIELIKGEQISIPIEINEYKKIIGIDASIRYGDHLQVSDVTLQNSVLDEKAYRLLHNQYSAGKLEILIYSKSDTREYNGDIFEIEIKALSEGQSYISLDDILCNEEAVNSGFVIDGQYFDFINISIVEKEDFGLIK